MSILEFYNKSVEEVERESQQQAEQDLKNGILGFRTLGLIDHPNLLVKVYKDEGIELNIVAGDFVCEQDLVNMNAYNKITQPEIEKRFGKDTFSYLDKKYDFLSFMKLSKTPELKQKFQTMLTELEKERLKS